MRISVSRQLCVATYRAVGVAALAIAIAAVSAEGFSRPSPETRLSVSEVFRNAPRFRGKAIKVRGFLSFRDDSRNLWQDRSTYDGARNGTVDYASDGFDKCIAVFGDARTHRRLAAMNNRNVVISGFVVVATSAPGDVNLDHCSDIGVRVVRIDAAGPGLR